MRYVFLRIFADNIQDSALRLRRLSYVRISALLTMLNSCAAGVSVVNIDNGFSAGVTAALINRKKEKAD